jgi:starch-binding outer membrane protein, SusD/RagB family
MWVASNVNNKWGFDSYKQSSDNPRGGYILRKFMPDDGPINWQTTYTIPWPFFRLAEIYLNYAEAKFELGDEATARQYINKVRARVGMPAIPATVTGAALRQRLYNERRIELAFEGHRFFDIRRWKIADVIENRPIRGMDILKNLSNNTTTYNPNLILIQKVPWRNEMYLLPIATDEIKRNSPALQTPGWQ